MIIVWEAFLGVFVFCRFLLGRKNGLGNFIIVLFWFFRRSLVAFAYFFRPRRICFFWKTILPLYIFWVLRKVSEFSEAPLAFEKVGVFGVPWSKRPFQVGKSSPMLVQSKPSCGGDIITRRKETPVSFEQLLKQPSTPCKKKHTHKRTNTWNNQKKAQKKTTT